VVDTECAIWDNPGRGIEEGGATMTCRSGNSKVILALGVFLIAVTVFCSSDKKTNVKGDDGDHPVPSSPEGALEALAHYYEAQDVSGYAGVLCEDYLFLFTAEVAESLTLPEEKPWWGKTEDLVSTGNMFDDATVKSVRLNYMYLTDWEPCYDERPDTTYTGLCCRVEPDIKVSLERHGYEPRTLWVNDSWLDVMVVPDPHAEGYWCVLRIEEVRKSGKVVRGRLTGSASATEASTWSGIKAVWAGA
jgi:hypothetical protein